MDDTVVVLHPELAPRCARSSLKRARLLFNNTSVLPPSSDASPSDSMRDISSYIPPMYDRDGSTNRANVSRRVKLAFNTDVESLAFRNFDLSSGEGNRSKKETATVRALREISDMASERIRLGLGTNTNIGTDGGGERRLVLHREENHLTSTTIGGGALVSTTTSSGSNNVRSSSAPLQPGTRPIGGGILIPRASSSSGGNINIPTPKWHAPWKLSTVISSHLGWVRSVAFDPTNVLFATGGADRVIKIFDLAKSCIAAEDALRITLTGHISPVRGLAFSERHPYLFSAGEDKLIKCWDLETNQVIRHYHGHLSGIFALKLHPTLDLLVTGGRDAVARVWDMRTKHQVHCLTGHDNTVGALLTKGTDPQIITGSYDSTIKLWDLAAGKCMTTLTHHKKSVRALARPTYENTFISGAADTLKKWVGTDGRFVKNFTGHGAVINALAINDDGVVLSGADDGTMNFWDYSTGYCFQTSQTVAQPGSLDAENGIFAAEFDLTGTRLITCEADKTIKIWKEDDRASEMSHSIDMKSWRKKCIAESKRRY